MILSTGWRTDIPAFYSKWLENRVKAGYILEMNISDPTKFSKISMSPKNVEIMTFCSKDYAPMMSAINTFEKKYRCFYWYSITPYGNDVELYVPSVDKSIETFIELSKKVGKHKVVWRYDPILFTTKYTLGYHTKMFKYMAERLAPYTDRCVFSFVHVYAKTKQNMPELIEPLDTSKASLCRTMLNICNNVGLELQTCGMGEKWDIPGIVKQSCTNAPMFERAFNIKLKEQKPAGWRNGCNCISQHTIGTYLTCLHGCKYCYATKSYDEAAKNTVFHNPHSPLFIGELPDEYTIEDLKLPQVIDYDYDPNQLNLF